MTRKDFLQRYWRYYLILEEKFRNTLNYVELDERNAFSFSNEYALLLQSIGAELDNFFKVYCDFSAQDRKTINDYCSFILSDYPDIVNQKVLIPERDIELQSYCGWNTSQPSKSLMFWDSFCKIKHSRYENIQEANQKNVLDALAALYLLEMKYLSKIAQKEPDMPDRKSDLFELKDWRYRYIPLIPGFAIVNLLLNARRVALRSLGQFPDPWVVCYK